MKENRELKYPVGIQSFKEIRENGFLYVDKTSLIRELTKGKYYFLSRPRRFGKSLFLSTLEAYFKGEQQLFRGLDIYFATKDWRVHPVFHLDLNNKEYIDSSSLRSHLNNTLDRWEKEYELSPSKGDPEERFASLIRDAHDRYGQKVVILVDEYDKPLLNCIDNPELADIYRSQLKAFYSNLKSLDDHIRMGMLTGVARFSKVSIFSDLNNLNDISFDKKFAAICGITTEELEKYFALGIQQLADENGMSEEEVKAELRKRYDGYHFTEISPDLYNPFSLVNVFSKLRMGDYWFDSGTPSYLVTLIEKGDLIMQHLSPVSIGRRELEAAGLLDANPIPSFYQSGYLTIKGYDKEFDEYILDYPNEEVKFGFIDYLMKHFIPLSSSAKGFSIIDFAKEVRGGKIESFMKRMESLIAGTPYIEKGNSEDHFQNAIYLIFTLLGYYAKVEDRTSDGRIDLHVETDKYIYIFEFKIDSTSDKAIEQILERKYWLRDSFSGKEIYLIGANFDSKTRRLTPPVILPAPKE